MSLIDPFHAMLFRLQGAEPEPGLPGPETIPPPPSLKPPQEVIERLRLYFQNAWNEIVPQFTSEVGLYQLAVLILTGTAAFLIGHWGKKRLEALWTEPAGSQLKRLRARIRGVIPTALWALFLGLAMTAFAAVPYPYDILRIASNLLIAWVAIRLVSSVIGDAMLSRLIAFVGWAVAALAITGLLDPTMNAARALNLGLIGLPGLSLLRLLQAIALTGGLFWGALALSRFIQGQVTRSSRLPPSVRVLVTQVIRFTLLTMAVLVALSLVGINLTTLTVLTGAIGVGLGFGMRAIFENFISGIILIFEKSLKVGDYIELEDGTAGTVREVNMRSTIITTNDNIDILVPNSLFITGRVTNWTLRDASRRLRIPFGVAYGSDKEQVKAVALEAAENVRHTLKGVPGREPDCWLIGFGTSSLDFELIVWISDWAISRPARVKADYYWALETALGRHGIAIPFPQLDLHVIPRAPKQAGIIGVKPPEDEDGDEEAGEDASPAEPKAKA
jgi:potassium-dependent mechanosensitive channel